VILNMPLIMVCLRMIVEFYFRNAYNEFFNFQKVIDIAMTKINFLISTLFDPNNFYSRFSFLESDIKAVGKKIKEHFSEEKLLRKRIFSTSPYLSLLLPRPENGLTRYMMKYNNKNLLDIEKKREKTKRKLELFGK